MAKKKRTHLLDIECYPNLFFVGVKDFKEKTFLTFEVSDRKDEREELYSYLTDFDGFLVSFNGIYYDNVVLKYFMKEYLDLIEHDVGLFLQLMKDFSDLVIEDDFEEIKFFKWHKTKWTDIDLFCYWSKMLRLSKKISLKTLGIQLNHEEVQELPYPPETYLTNREIEEIVHYNLQNDLGILEKLFVKMQEEILLRGYITKTYGVYCWSMDAPKIAGEILINDYCQKTFSPTDLEQTTEKYTKEFKQNRYNEYYGKVKDCMGTFNVDFELPFFKKLKDSMYESSRDFSYADNFEKDGEALQMSYGIGGAHSINNNEIYKSNDDEIVVTSDFALI